MKIRPFNKLSSIYLFVIIVLLGVILQRQAIFDIAYDYHPYMFMRELRVGEYLAIFGIIILLSTVFFITEKKKGMLKHNFTLISVLGVLFLISLISILVFPSVFKMNIPVFEEIIDGKSTIYEIVSYKEGTIFINAEQKGLYVLVAFSTLYLAYIFLWILPQKLHKFSQLSFVLYVILGFALVAIISSYIIEFDLHKLFYSNINEYIENNNLIKSFFNHKNSYAITLVFATFSCFFLYFTSRKIAYLPLSIIYIYHAIQTYSKTNVLILLVSLPILIAITLAINFKKHKKVVLGCIYAICGVITLFAILFVINRINQNFLSSVFSRFDDLVNNFILNAFNNQNGYSGRIVHYEKMNQLFSLGYWGIGLGFGLFNEIVIGVENISRVPELYSWDVYSIEKEYPYFIASDSPHSSFYQIIGSGGILLFIIYILIIAYVLYAAIKVFKKHKAITTFSLTVIISAIIHGLMESSTLVFFGSPYVDSILFTILGIVPILTLYHHQLHPEKEKAYIEYIQSSQQTNLNNNNEFAISKAYLCIVMPVLSMLLFSMPKFATATPWFEIKIVYIVEIVLLSLIILLPLIEFLLNRKADFKVFALDAILPSVILFIAYSGFTAVWLLIFPNFTYAEMMFVFVFTFFINFVIYSQTSLRNQTGLFIKIDSLINKFAVKRAQSIVIENNENKKLGLLELSDQFFKTKVFKRKS